MRYLLHDVFLKTVKDKSDNIAIEHEFGECFTYKELNSMANYVGQEILKSKYKSLVVGILSHVNAFSIASIIGTIQIGCAYVPLDEQSPIDRLSKIVNNLKLSTIIIDECFVRKFSSLLKNENIKKYLYLQIK